LKNSKKKGKLFNSKQLKFHYIYLQAMNDENFYWYKNKLNSICGLFFQSLFLLLFKPHIESHCQW
jgi:hypothetical protein